MSEKQQKYNSKQTVDKIRSLNDVINFSKYGSFGHKYNSKQNVIYTLTAIVEKNFVKFVKRFTILKPGDLSNFYILLKRGSQIFGPFCATTLQMELEVIFTSFEASLNFVSILILILNDIR